MRHTIETAPRDGNVIILEDDASGTYDVAHWSPEAGEWVGENGEPSKITPTHWHTISTDKHLQGLVTHATVEAFEAQTTPVEAKRAPTARWRLAAFSIAATLVAAMLIGTYLRSDTYLRAGIAAYLTPRGSQQDIFRVSTIGGPVVEQRTNVPSQDSRKPDALALQQEEASSPEARQSSENEKKEHRIEVLANELADARRAVNGLNLQLRTAAANSAQLLGQERRDSAAVRQQLAASTTQLEEERARSATLADQLAAASREIETQSAPSGKTGDEAAQLKQAAESTAELRQSLQQEHDRAEALASELAAARRDVETQAALSRKLRAVAANSAQLLGEERHDAASARQQLLASTLQLEEERARSAALAGQLVVVRREIETQAALSRKTGDDTAQLKQAAESAAELRQSLQQEHDRAEALTGELATARREIEAQAALSGKTADDTAQLKQAAESATAEVQQSLQQEHDRAEALASELATARREIERQTALTRKTGDEAERFKRAAESAAELGQSLQEEHDRAEALASELATARREVQTQAALTRNAGDEAAQFRQAAESTMAELRQSVQQEHDKAEALASELVSAGRDLETHQAALSGKTADEAAQFKQAAESATAELGQSLQQEHDRAEALASELVTARRDLETQATLSRNASDETAQLKQAHESATAELRQSLQQEHDRAEALTGELATARREIEAQAALTRKTGDETERFKRAAESAAELGQSLQQEHARVEALASELAMARRDVQTQAALTRGDEAAQFRQAAESTMAELRQSVQQQHDKAEALASELATARREIERQAALSGKTGDDTAQFRQAAESATAELRQSLQQEHDRAEALASELARAPRNVETQMALFSQTTATVDPSPAPAVAPQNSNPAIKPVETVPFSKALEHEPRGRPRSRNDGHACQRYQTYDPASGTYRGHDGRRHSCVQSAFWKQVMGFFRNPRKGHRAYNAARWQGN